MLKVPTRASRCQRCQRSFGLGEQVVSFLIFGEEEILRCDVCEACAPESQVHMQSRASGRPLALWKAQTEEAARTQQIPEALLTPLRSEHASLGLRWLLALYLERQHLLILQKERGGIDAERWLELPETGECFYVRSAQPSQADLIALQRLMGVLSAEPQAVS